MSFRSRLRPLKHALAPAVEFTWRSAFTVAGWVRPARARSWASTGGTQVLIVAPHPDDEVIGCSGTALRHFMAADRVSIAIATDGRRSGAIPQPDLMAAKRAEEAASAARLLHAELCWIGLREGEWAIPELVGKLGALISQRRPEIVYAPSRVDFHPEHRKVAHSLALALQGLPATHRPSTIRVYQIQVPLTAILVNLVSDLESVRAESEAALRAHASQTGSVECTYRRRRYSARLHRMPGGIEEFWELGVERYIELHLEPPAQWTDAYRGIRNFPLTDPLAWLIGAGHRRELRRRVASTQDSAVFRYRFNANGSSRT